MKLKFKRGLTCNQSGLLYNWFCEMSGVEDPVGLGQGDTIEEAYEDYLYNIQDQLNREGYGRYNTHPEFIWLKERKLIV